MLYYPSGAVPPLGFPCSGREEGKDFPYEDGEKGEGEGDGEGVGVKSVLSFIEVGFVKSSSSSSGSRWYLCGTADDAHTSSPIAVSSFGRSFAVRM